MVTWLGMMSLRPGQGWWEVDLFCRPWPCPLVFPTGFSYYVHITPGYTPYKVTYASDYFDQLYAWAVELIHG